MSACSFESLDSSREPTQLGRRCDTGERSEQESKRDNHISYTYVDTTRGHATHLACSSGKRERRRRRSAVIAKGTPELPAQGEEEEWRESFLVPSRWKLFSNQVGSLKALFPLGLWKNGSAIVVQYTISMTSPEVIKK
jgi:hypothetical protein